MRRLLLTTTAAVSIAAVAPAQESGALQGVIDGGIEMLNAQGTNITYDSREVGADDSLTFNGFRVAPDGGENLELSTDWIRFTPATDMDAGVTVTVAPVINLSVRDDDDMALDLAVATEDFALTTNMLLGGIAAPRLDLNASRLAVTGGGEVDEAVQDVNVLGQGLNVSFAFDLATQGGTATAMLDSLLVDVRMTEPDGTPMMEMHTEQEATKIEFAGEGLPLSGNEDDIFAFLSSDGRLRLSIESGASSTVMGPASAEVPFGMQSTSEGGSMSLSVGDGMFNYNSTAGAMTYAISPNPQVIPLPPMDMTLDGLEMVVQVPVAPTEAAQQARLVLGLRDLAVSESAWALIDPEGSLPREPATLEIDLGAMMRLLAPLGEIENTDDPTEAAEAESVSIDQVHLDAAGAELDADGALEIDNSGPFPMPNGTINISVRGAQTLAEKLVDLGLVDEMQVGMVMGMLMAFAEQGDAPDHFTSTIEFEDGGISANGQEIK